MPSTKKYHRESSDSLETGQFFAFLSASIILTLAPGPDILYLLATSLGYGCRKGAVLALGLCSGLIFHTLLVAGGVAAIIQASPFLFGLLKYAGAAYLLYLAYMSLRSARDKLPLAEQVPAQSPAAIYRRGLIMNVLNPKVLIFFLAFLPQFVNPAAGSITGQILFLGFVFGAETCVIFLSVSFLSGFIRRKILAVPSFPVIMARVQCFTLLAISLALILS